MLFPSGMLCSSKIDFQVPTCMHAQLLSLVWLSVTAMDCSPSGSSVLGILQVRILEWVANSSSGVAQGLKQHLPGLLHWQTDSLPLSHLGSTLSTSGWTYLLGRDADADENGHVDTAGVGERGEWDTWESRAHTYALQCVKRTEDEKPLYITGCSAPPSVMTQKSGIRVRGMEVQERGDICVHRADSRFPAETNTTVWSNYTPIKHQLSSNIK